MNNVTRSICGVDNETSFFDVLAHEYDPETSKCIPFAVSAPFMLKFFSYTSCALASACACSILIVSISLFPVLLTKIREQKVESRTKNTKSVLWLYCCFCFCGFIGSTMMAVSAAKGIYFVVPIDTYEGASNVVTYVTGISLNMVALFSYALTFKEIRISSLVVSLLALPSAQRTLGFVILYSLLLVTFVIASLASGWITDTFSFIRFLVGWGTPAVAVFGVSVPNVMVPVLKLMDDMLSQMDEHDNSEKYSQSRTTMKKVEKAKGLGIIQEHGKGKESSRMLSSSSSTTRGNVNRKSIEQARVTIWRLKMLSQVSALNALVLTVVLVYTPLIYEPYVILTFQLLYTCSPFVLILVMVFPIYHNTRVQKHRITDSKGAIGVESTVMDLTGTEYRKTSVQMSQVDRVNHVVAENANDEFY